MTNLERWIAAYNAMDPRRRAEMLTFAQDTARAYPAIQIKPPPALRLIEGGGRKCGYSAELG